MIERYSLKEMRELWSLENKFRVWLKIEVLACEAHADLGNIPKESLKVIQERSNFDIARIDEIEKETRHDVIAFLTSVAEYVGPDSRFIHMGLTSSDVVDTALCYLCKEAGEIIIKKIDRLMDVLKAKAYEYKDVPCMGRTHGVHAEPTTFGLKMALFYQEMKRNRKRLAAAIENISVGLISGAVGTHAHLSQDIEKYVCEKMGLKPAEISTQIIQRDRHAEYLATMAIIASSMDNIALEIRHLQRTEVLEAEEFFAKGQKGSSAMPHKRNPVNCEQICGLARVVRGNAQAGLENVALWHERDISHSSVERVIIPDSTMLVDYMLDKTARIMENLLVYPERMMRNIGRSFGLFYSQRLLLALIETGITREEAYAMVQKQAMRAWEEEKPFRDLVIADKAISMRLEKEKIEELFDLNYYLRKVDDIFRRVFSN
ncbi:MAG: adenylosuccinate lyase [Nitrospinota bacterium]|nr:adenylosuccinate lyase [Nitrospinota bacterium]